MTRLKSVDAVLILERMRGQYPEEIRVIQNHIDELTNEESWAALVREVVEGMAASRNAEERTSENLLGLRPLIERTTEALERMAEQERRRNDLEERRVKMDEAREHRVAEMRLARLKEIASPLVGAAVGAISTIVAFYFRGTV